MKKLKVLFLFSIFFFVGRIYAKAEIFTEPEKNMNAVCLSRDCTFNILKGMSTEEELYGGYFGEAYINYVDFYVVKGECYLKGEIYGESGTAKIQATMYAENGYFYKYQIHIDDELIFEFTETENQRLTVTLTKEVDLNKVIGYSKSGFHLRYEPVLEYSEGVDRHGIAQHCNDCWDYWDIDVEFVDRLGFSCLYATMYKVNDKYDPNEIHFISESSHPLSMEEIKNSIRISDETEGELENFEILDNTYILDENNYIVPGNYEFTIKAQDAGGNITLQHCYVDVYDLTPPVITGKEKTRSYDFEFKDLTTLFTATDLSGSCKITIIENNYTPNKDKLGDYTLTAKATDPYGNYSTCTTIIHVVDKNPPVIRYRSYVTISTLDEVDLDYFNQYVTVVDGIDGERDVVFTDLDNYLNNKRKPGHYRIQVEASDLSGNVGRAIIKVTVVDSDYPVISTEDYVLIVPNSYVVTKEELIALLEKSGQFSAGVKEVSSNYFNENDPQGEYSLYIKDNDENSYKETLVIAEEEEVDFTPIPKTVKKKDYTIYIIGGVGIVFILGLVILGYRIRKKKH